MRKLSHLLIVGIFAVSAHGLAQDQAVDPQFDFELATVEAVESSSAYSTESLINSSSTCEEITPASMIDDIINLGKIMNVGAQAWELVKANAPVVEVQGTSANALPFGISCWETLIGWRMPITKSYRYVYKNRLGITVADMVYKVVLTPGGHYKGRGQFIANMSVYPEKLTVAWGYKVTASTATLAPINLGTETDPVAGIEAQINWVVENPIKHIQNTKSVFANGRGEITEF